MLDRRAGTPAFAIPAGCSLQQTSPLAKVYRDFISSRSMGAGGEDEVQEHDQECERLQ